VPHHSNAKEKSSLPEKIWRKIKPSVQVEANKIADSPFVECRHETVSTEVLRIAELHNKALVFLSAGENQYGNTFANSSDSIRRRIAICLHQPPSWLRLNWRDFSTLNGLGAIICLSREQTDFMTGICTTPTIFLRHGVNHDFFRPAKSSTLGSTPRLIFVGQWLRDFDVLAAAMELIWREQPETRLDCVIIRGARCHPALMRLARDQRVHWHADIAPEELLKLYQHATLLFLPLIDSVANNAIVEALATGLPVVSTRVGGVADYVPEAAGELCGPGNIADHAEAVLRWLPDRERCTKASFVGREFAETSLDWGHIAGNLVSELQPLFF